MTYRPRVAQKFEKEELEAAVSRRLEEILGSIVQVGSLYVEPGDLVLVQVDEEAEPSTIRHLQEILRHVFKENRGIFTTDNINFKIMRKSESDEKYYDTEKITILQNKIRILEKRLESLEQLNNKGVTNE